MAKMCIICGIPIYKGKKYCEKCKRKIHLEQMNDYYSKNTKEWQYGGKYYEQQKNRKCGTGSLGSHALSDFKKEWEQIQKEMRNLNLRNRKQNWRY